MFVDRYVLYIHEHFFVDRYVVHVDKMICTKMVLNMCSNIMR